MGGDAQYDHERDANVRSASDRRRIVFVNRFFFPDTSATSQILFELTTRLVAHGLDVHVVCSRQLYDNAAASLPANDDVCGVHVHRIWTSRFGRGALVGRAIDYASFYVTCATKLMSLLARGDLVVAKTDPPLISIVAAMVATLKGARLVNWLQDIFPEVASHLDVNPLPRWLNRHLQRWRDYSLLAARVNVVLGSRMHEYLQTLRIPADRIRIVANWANGDEVVAQAVESSALRHSLGLQDKFVVAYAGNLGRAHEFETILAAAERLRDRENIVFLMIGSGAKMPMMRAAAKEQGLTNLQFAPYQPRELLSDTLAAADVHLACLIPALEGLIVPSKFYGILAAGRPAIFIGDPDGELARVIDAAGCGAVVPRGAGDVLSAAIVGLAADSERCRQMGERARVLFTERYTCDRGAKQWIEVLGAAATIASH
jgi:glycosyltransferase involved in cell wall biosynthesis